MVLVDNNPVSFLAQPSNGIPVPSFYDDPSDDALVVRRQQGLYMRPLKGSASDKHPHLTTPPPPKQQHVAELIDQHLALADDVRPPLAQLFRLEEQLAPVRRQLRLDSMGPLVEGEGLDDEDGGEDDGGDLDQGPRGRKASGGGAGAARVPPLPRSSRR